MKEILKNLSLIDSISGNEKNIINSIASRLPANYEHNINNLGNLIVKNKKNLKQKNKLAVFCSVDEPGLLINKVEKDGSLRFLPIGPIKSNALVGSIVQSNNQFGVIGQKPIHLQNEEEKKDNSKIENLFIDIGVNEKKQAEKLIKIGDFANFKSDFLEFGDGVAESKNINCKIGATILNMLICSNEDVYVNYFAFLTKTLICSCGATTVLDFIDPNIAIILDYMDEESIYKDIINEKNESKNFVIHKKPQTSDAIFEAATKLATQNKFEFVPKIENKLDETEKAIMKARNGIKTLKISVPCRHSNSRYSNVVIKTMEQTTKFLKKLFPILANLEDY